MTDPLSQAEYEQIEAERTRTIELTYAAISDAEIKLRENPTDRETWRFRLRELHAQKDKLLAEEEAAQAHVGDQPG